MSHQPNAVTVESLSVIAYQQQPVITTELLAQLYGTDPKNINKNYERNAERFIEGKHFMKLEGETLREFKKSLSEQCSFSGIPLTVSKTVSEIPRQTRHLILWTERGAARHAKMLDTEQAWEVFEKLEDSYFSVKATPVAAAPTPPQALPAPKEGLSNALRAHINRTAHQAALKQYDTIQAIFTTLATDNITCGATEEACMGYINNEANVASGVALVNRRDLNQLVHHASLVINEAGYAIAAIMRIEQRSGLKLFHGIGKNPYVPSDFHKHDRLVEEVLNRMAGVNDTCPG